jgi:GntR family transcriptional regulator, transcriptional repressor for pyruvate dehydrogenase complex
LNRATAGNLEPIERRSVYDEVVVRLGEYIVQRGLKPGEKLPAERELMESLRVGRSSLREAVKALRAVGAIDVVAGGGMYVGRGGTSALSKPLSWAVFFNSSSIKQAIEARKVLETELAALAAERLTDEDLAAIRGHFEQMRAAQHDGAAYLAADVAFHLAIARAAHNDILYYALEMLQHVVRAWIRRILRKANGEPVSLAEHAPILAALERRSPEEARRAMSEHIDAASRRLQAASPELSETSEETR